MVRTKSLCSTVGVLLLMVVCLSVCSATRHALFVSTEMKDPEDALGSGNDADLGDSDSIEEKKLMDRLKLARRRNNNTKTDEDRKDVDFDDAPPSIDVDGAMRSQEALVKQHSQASFNALVKSAKRVLIDSLMASDELRFEVYHMCNSPIIL